MKYYISCPISVNYKNILDTQHLIKEKDPNAEVKYWDKHSYYNGSWLEECDVFVVIFPGMAFTYKISQLPIGVYREFNRAIELNKDMCLSYTSKTYDVLSLYKVEYKSIFDLAEGVSGTANNVFKKIKIENKIKDVRKYPLTPQECYPVPAMQEKRLLLFLK